MKITKFIIVLTAIVSVGCNPLGKGSSLNLDFDFDSVMFTGEDKSEVNSGGSTAPTVPNSGNPAEIHKVSYTVGAVFSQSAYNTSDGHNVSVSIKGATR
jgi:hypothetical protein